jgi:hypothetical protein
VGFDHPFLLSEPAKNRGLFFDDSYNAAVLELVARMTMLSLQIGITGATPYCRFFLQFLGCRRKKYRVDIFYVDKQLITNNNQNRHDKC